MTELIDFGSFQVNFLRTRHDTAGAMDMFELTLDPAGRMPVPHWHENWEEAVYGLEGIVTYTIAGERVDVAPGGSAFVPRGVVHGFGNLTDAPAKCLCILTPGVLGPDYFREIAAVLKAGKPDPAAMARIMERYGLVPG
jgi:quercetin dioxygenase-like cupin family protein